MHRLVALATIACLLAGVISACKTHYPTETTKKDSCDTCHTDTTSHPCDTCNINKDSLSHAWVWTEYTIPGETNLTGVWVFGPNDIHIVGNNLYKYDGKNFNQVRTHNSTRGGLSMDGALNGCSIFGLPDNSYWLTNGSIVFYTAYDGYLYDGDFTEFRPGATNATWGPSSNDIFVVGNGGQIHHYDGTKFTDMASPTTKDLRSVWGTSHNDVWACGTNTSIGTTILLHYDGSAWTEDPISVTEGGSATGGFQGVWACDSSGHRFATTGGGWLLRKTDNGLWRSDSGLIPTYLGGKSFIGVAPRGNNPSDLMAYGPWGFIAHWNGKDWKRYDELFDYSNSAYYSAAFSISGNTACVVGTKNGQSWVAIGRRGK